MEPSEELENGRLTDGQICILERERELGDGLRLPGGKDQQIGGCPGEQDGDERVCKGNGERIAGGRDRPIEQRHDRRIFQGQFAHIAGNEGDGCASGHRRLERRGPRVVPVPKIVAFGCGDCGLGENDKRCRCPQKHYTRERGRRRDVIYRRGQSGAERKREVTARRGSAEGLRRRESDGKRIRAGNDRGAAAELKDRRSALCDGECGRRDGAGESEQRERRVVDRRGGLVGVRRGASVGVERRGRHGREGIAAWSESERDRCWEI